MSEYRERFKRMKKNYENTRKLAEEMGEDFPTGTFLMKRKGGEVGERNDGSLYIKTSWVVPAGEEHEGRIFTEFQNINEDHLEYLHLHFLQLGVESPEIEEIEDTLEMLNTKNIIVKMKVLKNKGGYPDSKILSIEESDVEEEDADTGDTDTDTGDEAGLPSERDFVYTCGQYGMKIPKAEQQSGLKGMIKYINDSFTLEYSDVEDENDRAMFIACDIPLEGAPEPKAKAKAKAKAKDKAKAAKTEDSDEIEILRQVATDNGINFEQDDTVEMLAEHLTDGFKWSQSGDELSDETVEVMRKNGITVSK